MFQVILLYTLLVGSGTTLTGCKPCDDLSKTFVKPKVEISALKTKWEKSGIKPSKHTIIVSVKDQTLTHFQGNHVLQQFKISTSKYGEGSLAESLKTPLGLHRIIEKIGDDVPPYGIFKSRTYQGYAWKPLPRHLHRKDYVSTRILRLEGLEPGKNQGRDCKGRSIDTKDRVVYIHGTTIEWRMGSKSTKGCVHMTAKDVIALFNAVPNDTLVWLF